MKPEKTDTLPSLILCSAHKSSYL